MGQINRQTDRAEPPVALTIGGSDSGGGAGIQADLKTFHAFGVFGTSALTAVTAQNTRGVFGIQKVSPQLVARQIGVLVEDLPPAATKTGMLADAAIVHAVEAAVRETGIERLVVDPVMVSSSGDRLLEADAESAYRELYPLAALLTPNRREAEILSGRPARELAEVSKAARELVSQGCRAVLVTGGHHPGNEVLDVLHDGHRWHVWRQARIDTPSTHGSGCTLSAAIAAGLAWGQSLFEAVDRAIRYTREAIRTAPALGSGHGPLNAWTEPPE